MAAMEMTSNQVTVFSNYNIMVSKDLTGDYILFRSLIGLYARICILNMQENMKIRISPLPGWQHCIFICWPVHCQQNEG